MFRKHLMRKLTRERLDAFLLKRADDRRTLDIGCRNSPYRTLFPNRVGFDCDPGEGVDVVGDAHTLPFPDGSFDQVLCTEVLEHLHTPEQAIKEIERVLAPGGRLLLTTRFVFPLHDTPGDYFRYTKYGLEHLLRHWQIVTLEEEASTGRTFGVLLQRVGFQSDFHGGLVTKLCVLALARVVGLLDLVIKQEYGMRSDRGVVPETSIMTSGYYIEAMKPNAE